MISIVTTVYNCGKYIRESIDSILSQTFDDFEFIIINDGSTDNTPEIIRSFDDNRIRFLDHDENSGVPFRSNEAIDIAKGEYIAIHDGDDVSLPLRLSMEFSTLKSDKNLFCVGSYAIIVDEDGIEVDRWRHPPSDNNSMINMIDKGKNPVINSSSMFKKSDFINIGKYTTDKKFQLVHDLELWGKCLFSDLNFCTLDIPLIKYRINNSGLTFGRMPEMRVSHQLLLKKWRSEGLL